MTNLPEVNTQYLVDFLTQLLNTPSPTGLAEPAIALTEHALASFPGLKLSRTRKGALVADWCGERDDGPRAVTAHVDTLGAMVREIKSNGRLKLTRIGGFAWNTVEGEGVTVFSSKGRQIRGSILLTKASSHVFGDEVNHAGMGHVRFRAAQLFGRHILARNALDYRRTGDEHLSLTGLDDEVG